MGLWLQGWQPECVTMRCLGNGTETIGLVESYGNAGVDGGSNIVGSSLALLVLQLNREENALRL